MNVDMVEHPSSLAEMAFCLILHMRRRGQHLSLLVVKNEISARHPEDTSLRIVVGTLRQWDSRGASMSIQSVIYLAFC